MDGTGIANMHVSFQTESMCLQQKYFRDQFDQGEPYKEQQFEKQNRKKEKTEKGKGNENEIQVLGFLPHSLLQSDKPLMF